MNTKIKTAFIFSIIGIGGISTYLTIVLFERFSIFYLNLEPLTNLFVALSFVAAPTVFSIIALVMVDKIKQPAEGNELRFKKLAVTFSWVALGSLIGYLTLAITLRVLFGFSIFVI